MSSFSSNVSFGGTQTTHAEGASAPPDLVVATTRSRQTAQAPSPFRDVLTGGVGLLIRGAEVATSVVAGPIMAAAVREAGAGATTGVSGGTASRFAGAPGPIAPGAGGGAPTAVAGAAAAGSDLATVQSMQRESQAFNLQLLELQEDVQQENRRFTTVSNVLRAKHDTAKAAVSNIRS